MTESLENYSKQIESLATDLEKMQLLKTIINDFDKIKRELFNNKAYVFSLTKYLVDCSIQFGVLLFLNGMFNEDILILFK